jgi:protein transport protein SEC31
MIRSSSKKKEFFLFIRQIGFVMSKDWESVVQSCDLSSWQETMALLATYSPPEQFSILCELLAQRLEKERFDVRSALLCFIASGNFDETVRVWSSMAPGGVSTPSSSSSSSSSSAMALQDLAERMTVNVLWFFYRFFRF